MAIGLEVYQSPRTHSVDKKRVFLAGSISGAADWQEQFIKLAEKRELDCILYNPRRDVYQASDEYEQIKWEYDHFQLADAYVFYFSPETVAPITLFELGAHMRDGKPLFIYIDEDYARKNDVLIQLALSGIVHYHLSDTIEGLVHYVYYWLKSLKCAAFMASE